MPDPLMNLPTLDPRALAAPRVPAAPEGRSPREAAREFEGLLMAQLFQTLRKTVEPSGLFGEEGQARSTYEYLLDQAVVQHAMNTGRGWGLAERLEQAWAQREEKTALSALAGGDLKDSVSVPIGTLSR